MRAKHPTHLQAPAAAAPRGGGRPDRIRLPRPRSVAAGGALLVQLWGVGLGASSAQAATPAPGAMPGSVPVATAAASAQPAGPSPDRAPHRTLRQEPGGAASPADPADGPSDTTRHSPASSRPSGSPAPLLGDLADSVPELGSTTAPVDRLLQERIRAGGLPLPGQGKSVPDAFAIASVLLPSAPSEPHEAEPRASRDADLGTEQDPAPGTDAGQSAPGGRDAPASAGRTDGPGSAAGPAAAPVAARGAVGRPAAAREPAAGAPPVPAQRQYRESGGPTAVAAAPVGTGTTGTSAAVLVPITAGLLLTGAAMYKHRGLPRGH